MTSRYAHHHHPHPHPTHTRAHPGSNTATAEATQTATTLPPSGLNTQSQSTMAPGPSVRRNLFHHHLSRRPASAASSSSTSNSTNASTIASHRVGSSTMTGLSDTSRTTSAMSTAATTASFSPIDNGDIVARDQNGNYKLDIPVLPPLMLDEECEEGAMDGIEEGRPSAGSGSTAVPGSAVDAQLGGREKEKIEASLVEMMYRHRNRQLSSEPAEVLTLIHQSLRNSVAALDNDNWMYEVEDEIHI